MRIVSSSSSRTFVMPSQLMPSASSTSALAHLGQPRCGRTVPSQLGQVLAQFAVQEAGADHADSRIQVAAVGKGVFRVLGESVYSTKMWMGGLRIDVVAG